MYNHRVLHGPKEQRCATLRQKATARASGGAGRMHTYVPRFVDGQLGHCGHCSREAARQHPSLSLARSRRGLAAVGGPCWLGPTIDARMVWEVSIG